MANYYAAATDAQGRLTAPSVLSQIDARTKATMRADLPALAKELKIGGVEGSVPIFPTLAEAQAWEAANPGRSALTTEDLTPDTTAPVWTAALTVGVPGDSSVVVTASSSFSVIANASPLFTIVSGGPCWAIWPSSVSITT